MVGGGVWGTVGGGGRWSVTDVAPSAAHVPVAGSVSFDLGVAMRVGKMIGLIEVYA